MVSLYRCLLIAALGLAACSSADSTCRTSADCFAGEVCGPSGTCGVPSADTPTDTGSQTQDQRAELADGGVDAGPNAHSDAEAPHTSDTGEVEGDEDAALLDGGGDDDMTAPSGACVVDPFTYRCADDALEENDEWVYGENLSMTTLGCNPEFQDFSETFTARMCQNDGADYYYVNYVNCDDASWVLEFQLEFASDCDLALVGFAPYGFDCTDAGVQCLEVDGKPTIRILVNPTLHNLQSAYVQVDNKGRNDVVFDYELHVTARQ